MSEGLTVFTRKAFNIKSSPIFIIRGSWAINLNTVFFWTFPFHNPCIIHIIILIQFINNKIPSSLSNYLASFLLAFFVFGGFSAACVVMTSVRTSTPESRIGNGALPPRKFNSQLTYAQSRRERKNNSRNSPQEGNAAANNPKAKRQQRGKHTLYSTVKHL